MSYILDALKRAESERERGAVPGLHARQMAVPAPDAPFSTRNRVWLGLVAALLLGAGAALWWAWQAPGRDVRLTAVESTITPSPSPTPLTVPVAAAPINPAPAPVAVPVLRALPAPARAPVTPTANAAVRAPAAKSVPAAPDAAGTGHAAPASPAGKGAALATTATPPAAVPLLSELAEDVRRQIPALTITGAVYSSNPGQRLLLINNLVLTQGSEVAPELLLEQIGEHNSVFAFRGTRFRLTH